MLKGIIFHFDDIIYDYYNSNNTALTILFFTISKNHNIDIHIIEETYNKINSNKIITNNNIYIKSLLKELNIHSQCLEKYINIYNSEFYKNTELFDNLIDVLQLLKNNNIKISLYSNTNLKEQQNKLIYFSISKYFDYIYSSDEYFSNLVHIISNKLNIESCYCGYLSDSDNYNDNHNIKNEFIYFHFIRDCRLNITENCIQYGNYKDLYSFLYDYFNSSRELIFLSKYFGQSVLNTQGPGSNISIKFQNCMFIKSSGAVLANINEYNGYCLVNNDSVLKQLQNNLNNNKIEECKIFGNSRPSMETYFHCFLNKYTVHIHFTLANIFLCSNNLSILDNIKYPYVIIDYYQPGIILAHEIYKKMNNNAVIYFLKNHGIIICNDSLEQIIEIYEYLFCYFDTILNNQYKNHFNSFIINKNYYHYHNKSCVVKYIDYNPDLIKNMIYCFPDLAIFIENIKIINYCDTDNIESFIKDDNKNYDIIIINNDVYIVSENLLKIYNIIELLDTYKILAEYNIVDINNIEDLQNMEQEKQRKRII